MSSVPKWSGMFSRSWSTLTPCRYLFRALRHVAAQNQCFKAVETGLLVKVWRMISFNATNPKPARRILPTKLRHRRQMTARHGNKKSNPNDPSYSPSHRRLCNAIRLDGSEQDKMQFCRVVSCLGLQSAVSIHWLTLGVLRHPDYTFLYRPFPPCPVCRVG